MFIYIGSTQIYKEGLICIQFEQNNKVFTWNDENKQYVDNNGNEVDWALTRDILNWSIAVTAPTIDLLIGNGWSEVKKSYKSYKLIPNNNGVIGFATYLIVQGVVQSYQDIVSGGSRRSRVLFGIWSSAGPTPGIGSTLIAQLSKFSSRYALKTIGISAIELALVTNLNKEIFRYVYSTKLIKPNVLFQATGRNLVGIYRFLEQNVELNGVTKKGTLELLKDAEGNIFWKYLNGAGSEILPFNKIVDFGGNILYIEGQKLNILGKVTPTNGSLGTTQLLFQVPATIKPNVIVLSTPMTSAQKAMSVIDGMNDYWIVTNKSHIDNIILNRGPIRFIHDPRVYDNYWIVVADLPTTNATQIAFKQKCVDERLIKFKSFLGREYDYLISKGYILQENGLVIKP